MGRVELFKYRLAGMRKPDEFIVCPKSPDGTYKVQGNRAIARINPHSTRGILNWKGSNSKYGVHLSHELGGEWFDFPQEFLNLVREYSPESGDTIGTYRSGYSDGYETA